MPGQKVVISQSYLTFNDGINPLNAELNTICHFFALLGGATIVDVNGLRVKSLRATLPDEIFTMNFAS
jgi:hypothetical protein